MTDNPPKNRPFDDIKSLVQNMPQVDEKARYATEEILASYAPALNPFGSIGPALMWLSGTRLKHDPRLSRL